MRPQSELSARSRRSLIDWLPWSHTFGGNNNFDLVLANGGSYFIDEGKPVPGVIEATVRNLREVSPTIYYNVPKGFEMLLPYLQQDEALRRSLFARLQSFVYAGAALPPHVREELERLGRETVGEAIPILTSLGSTETGPSAISVTERACAPGVVGIPDPRRRRQARAERRQARGAPQEPEHHAGILAPARADESRLRRGGLLQARRRAALLRRTRSGTRLRVRRPRRRGFQARDRHLGQRRPAQAQIHRPCAPYVPDVVVAGHDRDDAAALVVPNLAACRDLAGLGGAAERRRHSRAARRCGRLLQSCLPPSTRAPAAVRGASRASCSWTIRRR